MIDKKQMTEEDIKLRFITPAITEKWDTCHMTPAKSSGHGEARIYAVFLRFPKSFGERYPSLCCKRMLL